MTPEAIKNLSTAGLYFLVKDCMHRIGSNFAGGNPDLEYIRKQEKILYAIQDELENR